MKKTILASTLALALIGSSLVYAQSFDSSSSSVTSSTVTTTNTSDTVVASCVAPGQALRFRDGLRNGRTEEVKKLQTILIERGHLSGTATGYFGLQTFAAVKKFQREVGVSTTGYVGPLTLEKLKQSCDTTPVAVCDYAAPPSGCYYTPGPGFDKRTRCGLVLECGDSGAYIPPANCSSWYDGCNTCSRTSPGGKAFCTLRACISPNDNTSVSAGAKCNSYFDTTVTCNSFSRTYTEGQSTGCIESVNGQTVCIADASYVCRSGTWNIEGSYPYIKEPPVACTMEARLCANGSMMPRDSKCGWHPEQCK
jgi:Putative peptidoglycan binding domain